MLHKIAEWLSNPNREFSDGLKIYNEYKVDKKLDGLFNVENPAPNSFQFNTLIQRVADIYRKLQANPLLIKAAPITSQPIDTDELKKKYTNRINSIKTNDPASNRPKIVANPIVDVKELPEKLQILYFETTELAKNRAGLHTEMARLDPHKKNDATRQRLGNEIVQLDDTISANWARIDGWWKENKSPKVDEAQNRKNILEKVTRINNLNNYINRAKAEIEENPELKEKREASIKKWQTELEELSKE